MRVLMFGGAPSRLNAGPVQWSGHTFDMIPHQFDRLVDFNIFKPNEMPETSPAILLDFSRRISGYDAVFCETPEALILAHEWQKRGEEPTPLLAFDVHCLARVKAMRRWYLAREKVDPWNRVRKLPWISWVAASDECFDALLEGGIGADQIYRINFSTAMFSALIPDANTRLEGGPEVDGQAARMLPPARLIVPGSPGRRDHVTCLQAASLITDINFWVSRSGIERVAGELEKAGLLHQSNVHWLKPLPLESFIALVKRADLLVLPLLPGKGDAGHTTVSLAHRVGTPVICSAVDGIIDYVTDGFDAKLVPPADPQALAEAIRALWTNRSSRDSLSTNGRASEEKRLVACKNGFFSALADARAGAEHG